MRDDEREFAETALERPDLAYPSDPVYAKQARIVMGSTSGMLYASYYAGPSDSDDRGSLRLVQSGGVGFLPIVSLAGTLFTASRDWPLWMGDYMGLVVSTKTRSVVSAYVDGSNGSAHVFVVATPM